MEMSVDTFLFDLEIVPIIGWGRDEFNVTMFLEVCMIVALVVSIALEVKLRSGVTLTVTVTDAAPDIDIDASVGADAKI